MAVSHNGSGPHAPSEYPPPVDSVKEFVKRKLDSEDERIDVGVAIVGGGTAGLATAGTVKLIAARTPIMLRRSMRAARPLPLRSTWTTDGAGADMAVHLPSGD